ncbi:DNA polymerase/3'-5' exonuclease PolX [Pirellulimonas nuda]|uniref:DNA polymerase beta n=1 Tax=Pirellulimonas nuda TaxID=2528009 RepID=A0A518DF47_9BACT|nr:DNA polymerase/3'-5' exonuclease PolX [Pirellulimonas nuda]QDU90062.1 DNA polymerase/3'-5' exonuclease PolX [Pirellulimonas nuda]
MNNPKIADAFDEIADLLEFQAANPFRVRAYRNAARKVRDLSESLAAMVDEGADLTKLDGIGKDLAEKIAELTTAGRTAMLDELRSAVPPGVLALLRIPGLGPKKAAALHKELGIVSLEMLRAACEEHKVRALKGFGDKTEEAILAGIDFAAHAQERVYWATADATVQELLAHLEGAPGVRRLEAAGSYRRGKETVGDLDLLADAPDHGPVMDRLAEFPGIAETLARGDTKMSVRLDTGMQVDLRVMPAESFGAALQYFTGSKEHNVKLRGLAKDRGLKVNEWGVFRVGKDGAEGERVGGATEDEVYTLLDLVTPAPELREDRGEFDLKQAPKLIELADLRGDLHMHTTATDGRASLREMVQAAKDRGLKYIAITDHSQRVSMAGGLTPERLREQWREIDLVRKEFDSIEVLKGIECDILERGGMDLPDDVLAEADWVIASLHYGQSQPRSQIMERLLGAVEHKHVSIVAHPTGRLINRREAYDVDIERLVAAAAAAGKLLELNANPARLDLNDQHCALAKKHGVPIVISSDAHRIEGLDVLRYGVLQARRGGLTASDVANTLSWSELKKLVGRK